MRIGLLAKVDNYQKQVSSRVKTLKFQISYNKPTFPLGA